LACVARRTIVVSHIASSDASGSSSHRTIPSSRARIRSPRTARNAAPSLFASAMPPTNAQPINAITARTSASVVDRRPRAIAECGFADRARVDRSIDRSTDRPTDRSTDRVERRPNPIATRRFDSSHWSRRASRRARALDARAAHDDDDARGARRVIFRESSRARRDATRRGRGGDDGEETRGGTREARGDEALRQRAVRERGGTIDRRDRGRRD